METISYILIGLIIVVWSHSIYLSLSQRECISGLIIFRSLYQMINQIGGQQSQFGSNNAKVARDIKNHYIPKYQEINTGIDINILISYVVLLCNIGALTALVTIEYFPLWLQLLSAATSSTVVVSIFSLFGLKKQLKNEINYVKEQIDYISLISNMDSEQ